MARATHTYRFARREYAKLRHRHEGTRTISIHMPQYVGDKIVPPRTIPVTHDYDRIGRAKVNPNNPGTFWGSRRKNPIALPFFFQE